MKVEYLTRIIGIFFMLIIALIAFIQISSSLEADEYCKSQGWDRSIEENFDYYCIKSESTSHPSGIGKEVKTIQSGRFNLKDIRE